MSADRGFDGAVRRFVRSTETGLFLPDRLAGPHQASGGEWIGVRATWRDVYGEDPAWDDVADRLSRFGLGQVLVVLGGVSAILNSYEPLEGQRRVVGALFREPDRVGRDFQECWDRLKPEGVTDLLLFFTEQQVVAIAKVALLVCPHVTERSTESVQPIGEALMMAADLCGREEASALSSETGSPGNPDALLRYVVTNGMFNASDNFAHTVARTHDLYLPDDSIAEGAVDLRGRFEEITGLDPGFAWATGMALLANWRTVDPKSDRPPGPLSLEAYMSALSITDREMGAIRRLYAVDAAEARDSLRERGCGSDSLRPYDIQPLDRSPLVILEERLYCPSVRLLRWKLTTGLHHVFLQPGKGNDEAARRGYLTHSGHVFEEYVEALFRRVFPPSARRYLDDKTLRQRIPSAHKACDGAVLYGDTVLLLECKATLLPYGVRADGNVDTLRKKVAGIFGAAAEQFDGTILAIEDGHLRDWVRSDQVIHYLPLVVTLDTLPIEPFFYEMIEKAVEDRGALTHPKARDMQVLAVSELELLEEYIAEGGSLAALLLNKIENDTYRYSPMKNYLLTRGVHRALRPNRHLQRRFERLRQRTTELLRARAGGPW
ncbi:hypothetical protein [Candidatus Palauibacter sp.]|uniref:hypothetical protein n=1 Tax=Candidatus Palauibacter sp. TaxID=3101350 RepID=UPI003B597515